MFYRCFIFTCLGVHTRHALVYVRPVQLPSTRLRGETLREICARFSSHFHAIGDIAVAIADAIVLAARTPSGMCDF